LKKFRSKCQDFIFARRTEKDDLMRYRIIIRLTRVKVQSLINVIFCSDIKAQEATAQVQQSHSQSTSTSSLTGSSMTQSSPFASSAQPSQPTTHMPVYYQSPGVQQAPPPYPAPAGIAPSGPFSVPMTSKSHYQI
jgi:hypothetical protein